MRSSLTARPGLRAASLAHMCNAEQVGGVVRAGSSIAAWQQRWASLRPQSMCEQSGVQACHWVASIAMSEAAGTNLIARGRSGSGHRRAEFLGEADYLPARRLRRSGRGWSASTAVRGLRRPWLPSDASARLPRQASSHHHPVAPCAAPGLPAPPPALDTPVPPNHTETASLLNRHTGLTPQCASNRGRAASAVMVGAFGVQNSSVGPMGVETLLGRAVRADPDRSGGTCGSASGGTTSARATSEIALRAESSHMIGPPTLVTAPLATWWHRGQQQGPSASWWTRSRKERPSENGTSAKVQSSLPGAEAHTNDSQRLKSAARVVPELGPAATLVPEVDPGRVIAAVVCGVLSVACTLLTRDDFAAGVVALPATGGASSASETQSLVAGNAGTEVAPEPCEAEHACTELLPESGAFEGSETCPLHGVWYTFACEGAAIVPQEGETVSSIDGRVCFSGTLPAVTDGDLETYYGAAIAFDLCRTPDEPTSVPIAGPAPPPPDTTVTGCGMTPHALAFEIIGSVEDVRVVLHERDRDRSTYLVVNGPGAMCFELSEARVWDELDAPLPNLEHVQSIHFQVMPDAGAPRVFDFCIGGLEIG